MQLNSRFVVLYIEDNLMNITMMKKALKNCPGIEVLTAFTGEEGLSIAEEDLPYFILMDIQLPGIDGITATAILKGDEVTNNIPVVALSANAMKEDIDRALSAGYSDYLSKSIGFPALYELINGVRLAKK